jgi:predicted lipoprotein with Yx(FWY)xxD motif
MLSKNNQKLNLKKMKTRTLSYFVIASLISAATIFSSCSKNNDNKPTTPTPVAVTGVKLTTDAKFGAIITDNAGRALYAFAKDAGATSNCVDGCAVTWPVFYKANPSIGTGLDAADFGVITRADGSKQITYKGWPLYYFMNDAAQGDVKGDGVAGLWVVAKADYTVMLASGQLVGHDGNNYNDQGIAGAGASSYLTDAKGHTLYLFTKDASQKNNFTKSDFSNDAVWPLDNVDAIGSIPSILTKGDFTLINTFGKSQLVYKNHPLYFFGQDAGVKGSTKGVSFPTPGAAIWKILNSGTTAL